MSPVTAAAVIPAAPMLAPGASASFPTAIHEDVDRLLTHMAGALAQVRDSDVVVLLAAGAPRVSRQAHATLAPLGIPGTEGTCADAPDVAARLARALGYPLDEVGYLGLAHSALALHVADASPDLPVVAVALPPGAEAQQLLAVAAHVAADDTSRVTVVAAGDLSAGLRPDSPRPSIDGAAAWDEAALRAVSGGDIDLLGALGPQRATAVVATGWPALVVAMAAAGGARLHPKAVTYGAPRGVGCVVASFAAA